MLLGVVLFGGLRHYGAMVPAPRDRSGSVALTRDHRHIDRRDLRRVHAPRTADRASTWPGRPRASATRPTGPRRPPGPEAFSLLGGVAGVAPSLDLGTGVLALQLRTPMVTAMAAATLQALVPDRDVLLGIGISSPVVTQQWHGVPYGDRPLDQVREYVALVRECLSGESVTFDGDFYSVKRFRLGIRQGERQPKIVIGALNPGMLAAGRRDRRRRAPELPARQPRALDRRAGAQGRRRRGLRLRPRRRGRPGRPPPRTPARTSSPTPWSTPTPATSSGPASPTRWPTSASATPPRTARAPLAAVSDRMVDAIDVVGDAAHVQATIKDYVADGVDHPIVMPLPWGEDRRQVISRHPPSRRRR